MNSDFEETEVSNNGEDIGLGIGAVTVEVTLSAAEVYVMHEKEVKSKPITKYKICLENKFLPMFRAF